MRDLLADNIALMGQLSSLHGTLPLPPTTIQRTWLREVPSLASWMYCFAAYIAIHEALRHGGTGWAEYDRVFQRQVSINPVLSWNMLEPSLQAATILGQRTSDGILCTICQECDHTNNQCAMAPFQQQLQPLPPVVTPAAPSRLPRRPETLQHMRGVEQGYLWEAPVCVPSHLCYLPWVT